MLQEPQRRIQHTRFRRSRNCLPDDAYHRQHNRSRNSGFSRRGWIFGCARRDRIPASVGGAGPRRRALRISADNLRRCMDERPQIRDNVLRFIHSFMVHSAQTALCGVRHDLEPRLARWLCLVCDALNCNALAITHDQLSEILGSRRASVTKTLLRLEEQGLVEKMRGVLQVRDRDLLRQKACGCYHIISDAYQARGLVCT